jgi:high affinity choline transporter 7
MRGAIFAVGALATAMGITITTIYGLWYLCADLVFVILFPQLVSVVYLNGSNTYGALSGYITGIFFRFAGGEALIHMPPLIKYPWFKEETNEQLFPFRVLSMSISFLTIVAVSYPLKYAFEEGIFPKKYDVFMCIVNIPEETLALKEPHEGEMTVINSSKGSLVNGQINPALKFSQEDLLANDGDQAMTDDHIRKRTSVPTGLDDESPPHKKFEDTTGL